MNSIKEYFLLILIPVLGVVSNLQSQAIIDYYQSNICVPSVFFVADSTHLFPPYTWNFGDGESISSGPSVSHMYSAIGGGERTYKVSLKATDLNGKDSIFVRTIKIKEIPDSEFQDANLFSPFASCDGATADPIKLIGPTNKLGQYQYHLRFEHGKTYQGNLFPKGVLQRYPEEGSYGINLRVKGPNGCSSTHYEQFFYGRNPGIPSLEMKQLSPTVCAPFQVVFYIHGAKDNSPGTKYSIDFGDDTPTVEMNHPLPDSIVHIFKKTSCGQKTPGGFKDAFFARITAYNNCGEASGTVEPIRISSPPKAHIGVGKPREGECADAIYKICDQSESNIYINSKGICSNNVDREWILPSTNDYTIVKGSSTDECIWVNFHNVKPYLVQLKVKSPCGNSKTKRFISPNNPPEASFSWELDTTVLCKNTLKLRMKSKDVKAVKWSIKSKGKWSFADNSYENDLNPEILLYQAGKYEVFLTFSNSCKTFEVSKIIIISPSKIIMPPKDTTACIYDEPFHINSSIGFYFYGKGIDSSGLFNPHEALEGRHSIYVVSRRQEECESKDTFYVEVFSPPEWQYPDTIKVCSSNTSIDLNQFVKTNDSQLKNIHWIGKAINPNGMITISEKIDFMEAKYLASFKGGCTIEKSFYITINEPGEVDAGPDKSLCVNSESVTLSGSPSGGLWQSISKNAPQMESNSGIINGIRAGIFYYKYTLNKGSTCEISDEVEYTFVDILPTYLPKVIFACETENKVPLPQVNSLDIEWETETIMDTDNMEFVLLQDKIIGLHQIPYTIKDTLLGCEIESKMDLKIMPIPFAGFTCDNNICVNSELFIQNLAPPETISYWDVSELNQQPFEAVHPKFVFDHRGTYEINHKVYYNMGNRLDKVCSNNISKEVKVSAPPSINDLVMNIHPRKGKQISFKPQGSSKGGSIIPIIEKKGMGKYNVLANAENDCGVFQLNLEVEVDKCPSCNKKKNKGKLKMFFIQLGRKLKSFFTIKKRDGCYY